MATNHAALPFSDSAVRSPGLQVFRSLDDLARFDPHWREISESHSPISGPLWTQIWGETLAEGNRSHVAAWRQEDALAIAPLALHRRWCIGTLLMAGVKDLHEPMDLTTTDPVALDALTNKLVRAGRPIFLERVPAESGTVASFRRAAEGRAVVLERPRADCPYITLDETWREPLEHLNSGRRSDMRRARRKAEAIGPIKTEILRPKASELDGLLDLAFEIEAKSWKGDAGTALARDAGRANFYRSYAQAAAREGTLRLCFLWIGDQPAAMQIALEQAGGFWLLKVGYDAQFSNCSPGLWLMRDTIAYSAEAGLRSYEFLGKAEAWTEVWTKEHHRCVSLRIYPYNLRGMTSLSCDFLEAAWRMRKQKQS